MVWNDIQAAAVTHGTPAIVLLEVVTRGREPDYRLVSPVEASLDLGKNEWVKVTACSAMSAATIDMIPACYQGSELAVRGKYARRTDGSCGAPVQLGRNGRHRSA